MSTFDHEVSSLRLNSAHDCMAFHCTEAFIITFPSSKYDLNNVERDVKHQTIVIKLLDEYGKEKESEHFGYLQCKCFVTSNGNYWQYEDDF